MCELLKLYVVRMLGHLRASCGKTIRFSNLMIRHTGIAPIVSELRAYAKRLKLNGPLAL